MRLDPAVGDSVRRDREASGVNDLAEQFDATWLRFRAAVDDLGDAQMESPTRVGWTAKEMLGHLGFWLEATEGVIVGIFRGEPLRGDFAFESGYVPDPDAPWPTADVHNAREASWARSRSAAEVVARLEAGPTLSSRPATSGHAAGTTSRKRKTTTKAPKRRKRP
jgi:DinB superfamily